MPSIFIYTLMRNSLPFLFLSGSQTSVSIIRFSFHAFPSQKDTTAHFPLHAHLRAPESPPPPGSWRSRSSSPAGRPTTTSALQVRKERIRIPDWGPMGPIAVVNGVVGSQAACGFHFQVNILYIHTSFDCDVDLTKGRVHNSRHWSTSDNSDHP